MLGYFAVTVIHWIQTWTTGALTCLCDLFARVCAWWPQFMSPNCTDFQSGEISGQVQSMWWSPIHLMTMFNHVQLQLSRASARNSQSVPLTLLCSAFKYDTLFSWGWSGGGGGDTMVRAEKPVQCEVRSFMCRSLMQWDVHYSGYSVAPGFQAAAL